MQLYGSAGYAIALDNQRSWDSMELDRIRHLPTCKRKVFGSIPKAGTNKFNELHGSAYSQDGLGATGVLPGPAINRDSAARAAGLG